MTEIPPTFYGPIVWGCRIHRLYLCRGKNSPNKCPRYDTKQSDGELSVMLEFKECGIHPLCHPYQVHYGLEW